MSVSNNKIVIGATPAKAHLIPIHASCFVAKILFILDRYKIEYSMCSFYNPWQTKKGKMPYVLYQGKVMEDSRFLLDWLKTDFKVDPNEGLTQEQKAISHSFVRMLEESFYFYTLYFRWQREEGYQFIHPNVTANIPWFLRWFYPRIIRRNMIKYLYGQGTGRLSESEVLRLAQQDLDALSTFLDDKKMFFNTKTPTLLDIVVFSVLSPIYFLRLKDPLYQLLQSYKNITQFLETVLKENYPQKYELFTAK